MPDKNKIILGTNDDTYIAADDAGNIVLQHEQGQRVALTNTSIEPATDETLDLGSATNKFKDLYLSSDSIFIGNTKLSSDPATGALSTVVADEQGQFTAPAAPVGGSSKPYDWKGSTTNYVHGVGMENGWDYISESSMDMLYTKLVALNGGTYTGNIEVIWGNYMGNPNTNQSTNGGNGIPISQVSEYNQDYGTLFVTDENGDDLSKFLADYMDENDLPIVNFEFSISAKLQVKDPVKAAKIPYFQAGQFNNLTDVTSIPLWTSRNNFMYAFKTAATDFSNTKGHTRGIMMGGMGADEYDYYWAPEVGADVVAFWKLGNGQFQYGQLNVLNSINNQQHEWKIGSNLRFTIDFDLVTPNNFMRSTDPAIAYAMQPNQVIGYFDPEDGIVFDMLVSIV